MLRFIRISDGVTFVAALVGFTAIQQFDPTGMWTAPLALLASAAVVLPATWFHTGRTALAGRRAAGLHVVAGTAGAVMAAPYADALVPAIVLLMAVQLAVSSTLRIFESEARLRLESFVDALTGIGNRRQFDTTLGRRELGDEPAYGAVLMADLDHFKAVNDRFGHYAGDQVLVQTAQRLTNMLSGDELVVRYGGEEFALWLPGADRARAHAVAEQCRSVIGSRPYELDDDLQLSMTLSVGYAVAPSDELDSHELIALADHGLYAAKHRGRDMVVSGHESSGPRPKRNDGATSVTSVMGFLERLSERVDEMDRDLVERSSAVYAERIARHIGLSDERVQRCTLAARFNDIGKLAIPEHILTKDEPLTDDEWSLIQTHPKLGSLIIELAPDLRGVSEIIRYHRESWDGSGYPNGDSGDDIPIESRIVAVSDAWQAMRSDRPWRTALDTDAALAELQRETGTRFDPTIVDALIAVLEAEAEADGDIVIELGEAA